MHAMQAAEKLHLSSSIAGKAYFITNDEPIPAFTMFGEILEPLGYGRPRIRLPLLPIFLLALFLMYVVTPLLSPFMKIKPSEFTPNRVRIAGSVRTINIGRAKRDLAYKPKISLKEGIARTVAHFQPLAIQNDKDKIN